MLMALVLMLVVVDMNSSHYDALRDFPPLTFVHVKVNYYRCKFDLKNLGCPYHPD